MVCDRKFLTDSTLINHMKMYTDENKESKDERVNDVVKTGNEFNRIVNNRMVLKPASDNADAYEASKSKYEFKRKVTCKIVLLDELQNRRDNCVVCDRYFSINPFMKRHMKTHTSCDKDGTPFYMYMDCDRKFSTKSALKIYWIGLDETTGSCFRLILISIIGT